MIPLNGLSKTFYMISTVYAQAARAAKIHPNSYGCMRASELAGRLLQLPASDTRKRDANGSVRLPLPYNDTFDRLYQLADYEHTNANADEG